MHIKYGLFLLILFLSIKALCTSDVSRDEIRKIALKEYPTETLFGLWESWLENPKSTNTFYQKLNPKHIIEAITNDDENVLVTYFALGSDETDYILQAGGPDFYGLRFKQIGQSNLYFCTQKVPKDAMFNYGYNEFAKSNLGKVNRSDMRHIYDNSVIGPEAPISPYITPNQSVPLGETFEVEINSLVFGTKKTLNIYLPHDYRQYRKMNLVILFDGNEYAAPANAGDLWQSWVPTPTILDNIIGEGKIPPTMAIFIPSDDNRNSFLTDARLAKFVAEEVIDWANRQYKIGKESQVILAGSSRGGFAAANIAFHYPDRIDAVLSQSGAFWITNQSKENWPIYPEFEGTITKQYKSKKQLPIRFYLSAGLYDLGAAIIGTNRQLRDILLVKGYSVDYREYKGGHAYLNWRHDVADGLISLLETTR
ncbi:alpha/beta hydrolase [Pleionea sediminis]|uniref:alpha/beta hydrolase n=1 Tax=Pleionea sediminis TaxID=2569479 RepID=UPI0011851706|nr:alpha/beta hydrolase-fold protein [Pleionea sediminis]